jgi:uncharacterized peroxidase-related enzyme
MMKTKIRVIDEKDATGEVASVYKEWRTRTGRSFVPGIYKCFSARPDVLRCIMALAESLHFSEGKLTRRMKEAIATYVSAINRCSYCTNAHAYFLKLEGASDQMVNALAKGNLRAATLSLAERAMLEFARRITRRADRVTQADVQRLRMHNWTDDQISEAVYVVGMFAMMNRVADTFGVPPIGGLNRGRPIGTS